MTARNEARIIHLEFEVENLQNKIWSVEEKVDKLFDYLKLQYKHIIPHNVVAVREP